MPQHKINQTLPVRVLPFSRASLRTVLPLPLQDIEDCSLCQRIAGGGSRLFKSEELQYDTIPVAVQELRYFMRLGENVETNWLDKCPQCDRLYYAERSYEFLVGGSEDYESYSIVTPDDVLQLAEISWVHATGRGEIHGYADGTWSLFREGKSAPSSAG